MQSRNVIAPAILGLVTAGVIGWTVHALAPPEPTISAERLKQLHNQVKMLDAKKNAMSPEERAKATASKSEEDLNSMAATWTKNGVYLSKDQGIRLAKLGDEAVSKGALSPSDVDFLISTISDPQTGSSSPGYIHYQAAYNLSRVKAFTQDQKDRILKACLPLFDSKQPLDQRCALAGAKAAHSNAAVKDALAMLNSDNENNRKSAQKYLDEFGSTRP